MANETKTHYHVMTGLHGCLPDYNEIFTTLKEARDGLKEIVKDLRDSKNTFRGSLKKGYFEVIKKEDFLGDYCSIETCTMIECTNNQDY
jgi:hypothetical protein